MTTGAVSVLRDQDREFLTHTGLAYTTTADGHFVNLIITGFETAAGLTPDKVDLLIRLPLGFPDAGPDMFWVAPNITLSTGQTIAATELIETYENRPWQRWSRHIAGHWRPGVDNLETYLAYIRRCLRQAGGN